MKWLHITILLMVVWVLGACKAELRELCYDHSHISNLQVGFDWQEVPEMHPKGMTVLFYDASKSFQEPERYDFAGTEGGNARLVKGDYRAVAYNYDTETILYRNGEDYTTLEAYTRYSSVEEGTQLAPFTRGVAMPRGSGTENEPVILEPDELCGAISDEFALSLDQTTQVIIKPEHRTKEVVITINNVPNLEYTNQFGGALSGLAPSVCMATGRLGEGCVTESFACYAVYDAGVQNTHLLTIYAILADGSKWYYTTDVTTQMHNEHPGPSPEGEEEIDVNIDGLPIPKPIVNGSGFEPSIDGWQSVDINVDM